jgi:hypothetical protein
VNKEAVTDDPQRRRPDISVARTSLNWEPKVYIREVRGFSSITVDKFF